MPTAVQFTSAATVPTTVSEVPTPVPARNGWTFDYAASMSTQSADLLQRDEVVAALFTQWLEHFRTDDAGSRHRLGDYDLIRVEVEDSYLTYAQATGREYIAGVLFSVKPTVYEYSYWNAGNGTSDDNSWVVNKWLYVGVREAAGSVTLEIVGTGI
jgi:hypothetical protein